MPAPIAAKSHKPPVPATAMTIFPISSNSKRKWVCGLCRRSFARLEHLNRHGLSHTKEKPFKCSECSRSFARRDLRLRHAQKLHLKTKADSRAHIRRGSASSTATEASASDGQGLATRMYAYAGVSRPRRAHTFSHFDGEALYHMLTANSSTMDEQERAEMHGRHPSRGELPRYPDFPLGGMNGVPVQLEGNAFQAVYFGAGMHNAPTMGAYGQDVHFGEMSFAPSTINPNALHYNHSPQVLAVDAASPHPCEFSDMTSNQTFGENLDWMIGENRVEFDAADENGISIAGQRGISDSVMLDGSNDPVTMSSTFWQQPMMAPPMMTQNPYALAMPTFDMPTLDMATSNFSDLFSQISMSPHGGSMRNPNEPYFSTPPPSMGSLSSSLRPGLILQGLSQAQNFTPETPSSSSSGSSSSSSSKQHAAILSTITEKARGEFSSPRLHNLPPLGLASTLPTT